MSNVKSYAVRLLPHQDLKKEIQSFAIKHSIKAGVIVTCVGSLEQLNLRFANQPNGVVKKGHFEIVSLTGTFSDSSLHLHMAVSDKHGNTIGGHLLDHNFIYTTVELVLVELIQLEFLREADEIYGFKELVIVPKKASQE
ncbi:MAG: DNA-binding protein [Cyclobacteriaceae bacterium]|nr:DNA-binding protein [Cyclobacteriaceae bacterium]